MVKPPLRTKSIGFKVSEEEYAQLETAAQASGQTLGEWCRETILRGAVHDPALAEIIGVRLLLVNVLGPLAAGEKVTPERFSQLLDQISEAKHQVAAQLQQRAGSRTSITVRIETDASKRPGNPIISITQPGAAGVTKQLDANGNAIKTGQATTGLPTVTGTRDANGNAVLNFTQDTKNPLEPAALTPGIRANLDVTVAQSASWVEAGGMLSGTPSFELNVGSTNIPLQTEPSGGSFGLGLFLPLGIENFTPLPPPPPTPPSCGTDKEKPCQQ